MKQDAGGMPFAIGSLKSEFAIIALCLLATLAMLPVLLHPHWGMFSDFVQIIETCRNLSTENDLTSWWNSSLTDLRPVVHWVDYLTWLLVGQRPLTYYGLRLFAFALTIAFTFLNCKRLCHSGGTAFMSCLFWFLSFSTYEVIYTLDKGEIFVAAMFSIVIWLEARFAQRPSQTIMSTTKYFLLLTVLTTCVMFTKQTGQLLVCYAGGLFVATLFVNSLKIFDGSRTLRLTISYFSLTLLAFAAFEIFYVMNGGLTHTRYKEVDYSTTALFSRASSYLAAMPELWVIFSSVVLAICVSFILSKRPKFMSKSEALEAFVLVSTACVGAVGICGWKGDIPYGWFPLLSFLIPAFAYSLGYLSKLHRFIPFLVVAGSVVMLFPERLVDAELQLSMDRLFNRLISSLQALEKSDKKSTIVFPFDSVNSFELGNVTREALRFAGSKELSLEHPRVANLIMFAQPSEMQANAATNSSKSGLMPGLEKYEMKAGAWLPSPVAVGDVIVVPSGNVEYKEINYRGLPMFYKTWRQWTGWLGQLELKPLFVVSESIERTGGKPLKIEWVGLTVTQSPRLSLKTTDGGWLFDGASVSVSPELIGSVVTLQSRNSRRLQSLRVRSAKNTVVVKAQNSGSTSYFGIPIFSLDETISAISKHEKPLFLIQDVNLSRNVEMQPKSDIRQ